MNRTHTLLADMPLESGLPDKPVTAALQSIIPYACKEHRKEHLGLLQMVLEGCHVHAHASS